MSSLDAPLGQPLPTIAVPESPGGRTVTEDWENPSAVSSHLIITQTPNRLQSPRFLQLDSEVGEGKWDLPRTPQLCTGEAGIPCPYSPCSTAWCPQHRRRKEGSWGPQTSQHTPGSPTPLRARGLYGRNLKEPRAGAGKKQRNAVWGLLL